MKLAQHSFHENSSPFSDFLHVLGALVKEPLRKKVFRWGCLGLGSGLGLGLHIFIRNNFFSAEL